MNRAKLFCTGQGELFRNVPALRTRKPSQIRTLAAFADYLEWKLLRGPDEV
jgi:hypothetical protein